MKELKPYTKKYTNADFYHDGIFDEAVAKRAFLDMFDHRIGIQQFILADRLILRLCIRF